MVIVEEIGGAGAGRGNCYGTVDFNNLPEGCIANALSFTSPRDACRLSLISSTFRSAAESDAVWERFLPPDYQTIISAAASFCPSSNTKKELFRTLCEKPILIDEGKMSFSLDKVSGKKCYMLCSRILFIVWGDTPRYWRWTSIPGARFNEVAELASVCWLEMRGWINSRMLSPSTLYGAYLVFKLTSGACGFDYQAVEVCVGFVGGEAEKRRVYLDAERGRSLRYQIVPRPRRAGRFSRSRTHFATAVEASTPPHSHHRGNVDLQYPNDRADGWLEVELGEFFIRGDEDKQLEMGVYEVKGGDWKGGLIVQGFEIRPKINDNSSQ
ncbi:hypothetical protein L6164_035239 [Bauhinia variegata]|uniref:Uncharacterized protein n=1 Tax=Bauhinia variegata TaxID=167791 RepID=A0ACB9KYB5_BAUVA|nr:hypothetical protein L6164_035239 [Bauhinia variegata]